MESQLQRDSKRAVQCEEEKAQLEEAIRKLQQDIREMRNTSEKFTASIQVRIAEHFPASAPHRHGWCQGAFQGQDSSPVLCSLQGFSEQEMNLRNQIKELEANVAAAAPDKTKQRELEKVLDGYKKGTFCGEGIREKSCSNASLLIEEGMGLGFSSVSWFGTSFS